MNWLIKIAVNTAYEPYRQEIENLSRRNPYPFRNWFDTSGRVYIPFNVKQQEQPEKDVIDICNNMNCQITDYRQGYCIQGKRTFRIPKIIEQAKHKEIQELQIKNQKGEIYDFDREMKTINDFYSEVLNTYVNSPLRVGRQANEFYVVISQDPHDLAQMSTGRGWTSCMELGKGSHLEDVFCEVQTGSLIAYLIRANDKNIEKPLARIHIRRFENKQGQSIAMPEESVYGNDTPGFLQTVQQWIISKQGNITPGLYSRKGGEWSDTFSRSHIVLPDDPKQLLEWYRKGFQEELKPKFVVVDTFGEEEEVEFDDKRKAEFHAEEKNEYEDSEEPRFEVEEREQKTNQKTIHREIVKKIINAPKGAYDISIIQEIKDSLDLKGYSNRNLSESLMKNYPELFNEDDYYQLGYRPYLEYIKKLPEGEKKEQLKQEELLVVSKYLDNPLNLLKEDPEMLQQMQLLEKATTVQETVNLTDGLSLRFSVKLQDKVLMPLEELFHPIPEQVIQKLVDLGYRINELHLSTEKSPIPRRNKNYDNDILRSITHVLSMTKSDTPTVQNFYKWLADNKFGDNHYARNRYSSINVETLGSAIAFLGENGRQFLPWAQLKLQEEREYENHVNNYVTDVSYKKVIKKNIERWLYIIDALEKGKPSGKYRFYNKQNWLQKIAQFHNDVAFLLVDNELISAPGYHSEILQNLIGPPKIEYNILIAITDGFPKGRMSRVETQFLPGNQSQIEIEISHELSNMKSKILSELEINLSPYSNRIKWIDDTPAYQVSSPGAFAEQMAFILNRDAKPSDKERILDFLEKHLPLVYPKIIDNLQTLEQENSYDTI